MADQDQSEPNSLAGRVRRYVRVGGAVGGLAARVAGARYLGMSLDRDAHARDLKNALGGLKGPLMKVAQIMSTIPDMLPPEYVGELAELQSNAPAMGWLFVRRRMTAELGPDWQNQYAAFEHEAAAAASLGQVHRATGPDGAALACKLQYPDMRSTVEADLRQLKLLFALFHRYDKAIDPTQIHAEISERLREELDYAREAAHMRLFRAMLSKVRQIHVPAPWPDLSTDRLLTMDWLAGENLLSIKEAPLTLRNKVARNMFHAWYVPFYEYGVIHGDPHLGNYSVTAEGDINLLDFGCIRVFQPSFIRGVIDLYTALDTGDDALAVHAYETWGFRGLKKEVIDVLNLWAEYLYAPLLENRIRRIQDDDGTVYGAKIAARVHRELHRLGGIRPPREFVLMDRAAIGLGSVFMHLRAEINWHQMFHHLIGGFDEETLANRQQQALTKAGVPASD